MPLEELFAGRGIDIPALLEHLKSVANDCGLPFGTRTNTFNSRRAQELGKWAESVGRGEEFHMAVFKAYFSDGMNIAEVKVLTGVVESLSLDVSEAEQVLANGVFKDAVDRDWDYSRASGITAVPTFVAAGRGLVGAQSSENLEQLIVEAGARRRGNA